MKLPFVTLDVFTTTRFAGNPLAVVFDADGVEPARMQAVAREFNFPETVFVLRPTATGATARARIFTPAIEMPFAGHPTVGTAVALALRRNGGSDIVLEEKIGSLKCRVKIETEDRGRASFFIPALPSEAGSPASRDALAAALGIDASDIGFDGHAPSGWSAGIPFTFVPLRDLDSVRRASINDGQWNAVFGKTGAYVFCKQTENPGNNFHARMFAPAFGIREDPATGSATAAFSGLCARALRLADGEHRFVIEQGFEMGRPSLIELGITMRSGALASASVGGPAVIVTEGEIHI
ncbi:MAG: PhzF family phenazine biosynthesis protein [Xanthobacteraceae bacterium]